jgi:hypothetical protein
MTTVASGTIRPGVDLIIDGTDASIVLDLGPLMEDLIRDIGRALLDRKDADLADSIVGELLVARAAEWARRSDPAGLITLPLDVAREMGDALCELAVPPEECIRVGCDYLAYEGSPYCDAHQDWR